MGKNLLKLILTIVTGVIISTDVFLVSQVVAKNNANNTEIMAETTENDLTQEDILVKEENLTDTVSETENTDVKKTDTEKTVEAKTDTAETTVSNPEPAQTAAPVVNEVTPASSSTPAPAPTSVSTSAPAPTQVVAAPAPAPTPAPAPAPAGTSITVGGRTLTILESNSMADESGNNVLRYKKLLRGHNSEQVFRVLYGMNSCNVSGNCMFSITENGVTSNYRISERVEYTVENYNTGKLSSAAGPATMGQLVNAKGHAYALFTCFGEYDATIGRYKQVLVLYADAA